MTKVTIESLIKGDIFSYGNNNWDNKMKFDRLYPLNGRLVVFIASIHYKGANSNHFTWFDNNQLVFKH